MNTKYKTEPFDFEKAKELEKAHPGEYIKTQSGENVTVLTFERSDDYPIVALIGVKRLVACYDRYGQEVSGRVSDHNLVLRTDDPVVNPRDEFRQELKATVEAAVRLDRTDIPESCYKKLLELAFEVYKQENPIW